MKGKPDCKSDSEMKRQRMPKKPLPNPIHGKGKLRTGKVAKEQP